MYMYIYSYIYICKGGKCWFTKCKSAQYHVGRANSNRNSNSNNLLPEDSPQMKQTVVALR